MSAQVKTAMETVFESARRRQLEFDLLAVEKRTTAISYQQRRLDQFSFSETRQLGVRVFAGKKEGVAYTENLERQALEKMLDEAEANAHWIERQHLSTLPEQARFQPLNGLHAGSEENVTAQQKLETAARLEAAALDHDSRITSVAYSRYSETEAEVWIANSHGLHASYSSHSVLGYAHCLATDKAGNAMAGEAELHRSFASLDPVRIAKAAADKTVRRLGAIRPKTGRYTVVIENRAAEQLVSQLAHYFSAKAVDERSSVLVGKLGQKVFAAGLHLTDDPFMVASTGCRPFDEEGYPCQTTPLVQDGRVVNFLTNSVLAKKMALPHTHSAQRAPATDLDCGPSTVVVHPGQHSFADLVSSQTEVIVITDLMGMAGFRAASGDFSIPVQGFLYEHGQVKVPLKDFLISGNILELFGGVEAVGHDVLSPVGDTVCPSLLIHDVNISGQT